MGIDGTLFGWLYAIAERSGFMRFLFAFFADYVIYGVVVLFFVHLFLCKGLQRKWYFFSLATLSSVVSLGIMTRSIQAFFPRVRPFDALDIQPFTDPISLASFPSGHMALLIPLLLVVWYMRPAYVRWLLGIAVGVGISRIAVGVHWPSDIVSGILFGVISFYGVRYLLLRYYGNDIEK